MKEKDRYILLSIVLFVEILALITFIFCGGDMCKNKILCFLGLNAVISIVLFIILWGANFLINKFCNYTGETVYLSKEDLHYKYNFKSAQEIYIDKDIANIPYKHFSGLTMLQCVVFEGENTTISENAFEECEKLERVYLPSKLEKIRENTFKNCDKLEEITIPDSVTKIGAGVFAGCSSLTNLRVDTNNTNYSSSDDGGKILYNKDKTELLAYPSATGDVTIPDSVTRIGAGAFAGCKGLTSVTIGSGVEEIGVGAFKNCKKLKSVTFEDEKGWSNVDNESINVSSPVENAKKLKKSNYNWYKQQN